MGFSLLRSFKESRTLVKFIYGDVSTILATTWKSPIIWKGDTYKPEPGIKIELPAQSGGLSEDPLKVDLPLTREAVHPELFAMAKELASPRAVPKTQIEIFQLLSDGTDQELKYLYEGTLDRSRRNPEGRRGIVSLDFSSELRYGLDKVTLGRRCDPDCDLIFGGAGCEHGSGYGRRRFNAATYYPNNVPIGAGEVMSAWVVALLDPSNPRKISLSLDPVNHPEPIPAPPANWQILTLSSMDEGYWIGSFIVDRAGSGLSIPIQAWEQGSNEFLLAQLPPKNWDGRTLFLQVDCPRTRTACGQRFNVDRFGGMGFGVPAYNPAFEVRSTS